VSDWQPGDLALCVKGGQLVPAVIRTDYPAAGRVYTVAAVGLGFFLTGKQLALWLSSDAPVNTCGERVWTASRFVKVTPGADIKGIEVERRVPVKGEPAHA
jgi:hypothetical protein